MPCRLTALTFVVSHFLPHLNRDAVYRILKAEGLNRLPPAEKARKPHGSFKDYEVGFIHVDVKHLPKLQDRDRVSRKRYLYVAIDRASRYVRMATCYRTNGHDLRYQYSRGNVSKGAGYCQSVAGRVVDAVVEGLLLEALRPSAIGVSLALAEQVEIDRAQRCRHRALKREQAAYEVARAERQYNAVDPENRLVARSLEKRWEAALAEQDRLLADQRREDAHDRPPLTVAEREAIRQLAEDIPTLWRSPSTTPAERKEIARLMLERVVLSIEGGSEQTTLVCTWAGGRETTHRFVRPVRWTDQLSRGPALRARIGDLARAGQRPPAIARTLTSEG